LTTQKKRIEDCLEDLKNGIQKVQESDILDCVLSLTMQASVALKSVASENYQADDIPSNFIIKEKFAPAQKMKYKYHLKDK